MVVKDEVLVKEIEDILKQRGGKILEDIKLLMSIRVNRFQRE